MTVGQILYSIMAALIFISGLFVLLRFRAIEPKFKPIYFIIAFFVLAFASAAWPAALFAFWAGVFLVMIDKKRK